MVFNRAKFLIEVLGPDGALALAKAAKRSEYLAQMVVPRTILAWLEAYPAFEGEVPGSDFSMKFTKSEDGFTGDITMSEGVYRFQEASIFHVAGALATAMQLDSLVFGNARNSELQRLGKSIDRMAKVRLLTLAKREILGREESSPGDEHGETSRQEIYQNDEHSLDKEEKPASGKCKECGGTKGRHFDRLVAGLVLKCKNDPTKPKQMEKAAPAMGGTGTTAGPVAPAAPAAPTATAPPATTQQKLPKKPASNMGAKPPKPLATNTLKLTRSEVRSTCQVCGQNQFENGSFVGCVCFSALAKSAKVLLVNSDDTVDIALGEGWDRDAVLTFLEAVGRK